jgi:hypothetical protein
MASLREKLQLLVEWSPLIGLASEISAASTPLERALKISAALKWAATKTQTPIDEELVDLLEAVLKSQEGAALFNYLVELAGALAFAELGDQEPE